jgi:hypothetical protein
MASPGLQVASSLPHFSMLTTFSIFLLFHSPAKQGLKFIVLIRRIMLSLKFDMYLQKNTQKNKIKMRTFICTYKMIFWSFWTFLVYIGHFLGFRSILVIFGVYWSFFRF